MELALQASFVTTNNVHWQYYLARFYWKWRERRWLQPLPHKSLPSIIATKDLLYNEPSINSRRWWISIERYFALYSHLTSVYLIELDIDNIHCGCLLENLDGTGSGSLILAKESSYLVLLIVVISRSGVEDLSPSSWQFMRVYCLIFYGEVASGND